MEITGVETIPVEVPVKQIGEKYGISPYVAGGRLSHLPESLSFEEALDRADEATTSGKKLLVKLHTDGDVVGWGETMVPTMRMGRVVVEELLEPELVGRKVWEVESFVEEFSGFASMYYTDVTSFLGGVEMAMWDAWGKHLGVPVHQLIGGKTADTVPIAFCLGLLTPEDSREHAKFAREEGFSVLKTKASRYWETDVERILAMHEAVDGELEFRLDPNQIWSFEDAVRVGAKLEDEGVYLQYLEQPVRVDSFGTLKRLRERLQTPIAVNEDAYFQYNIAQIAEEDAVDAAVVDVVPAGGILKFKKLAAVAAEAGISLSHHSNFDLGVKLAAKLHVTASTPAVNLPVDSVYYAYEDHILENPLEYADGELTVPDRPGLAGAVDEGKIEQYRLD
jgi:L-alanine-DL-glutamate epimerase-like enolase superfamily enzyme